jgi:cardiolipin synthase
MRAKDSASGNGGSEHLLADRAFSRAAGALLIPGNAVRLLRDAAENYPAWLDAIASATRHVHFESYIIRDDGQGERFAAALMAKAREGVAVRVLCDWLGAWGKTSWSFGGDCGGQASRSGHSTRWT